MTENSTGPNSEIIIRKHDQEGLLTDLAALANSTTDNYCLHTIAEWINANANPTMKKERIGDQPITGDDVSLLGRLANSFVTLTDEHGNNRLKAAITDIISDDSRPDITYFRVPTVVVADLYASTAILDKLDKENKIMYSNVLIELMPWTRVPLLNWCSKHLLSC